METNVMSHDKFRGEGYQACGDSYLCKTARSDFSQKLACGDPFVMGQTCVKRFCPRTVIFRLSASVWHHMVDPKRRRAVNHPRVLCLTDHQLSGKKIEWTRRDNEG